MGRAETADLYRVANMDIDPKKPGPINARPPRKFLLRALENKTTPKSDDVLREELLRYLRYTIHKPSTQVRNFITRYADTPNAQAAKRVAILVARELTGK